MKISNNTSSNLAGIDKSKTDKVDIASKDTKANKADASDIGSSAKLELSERAQQMKKIKDVAMASEEVNADKVAKFQKLIDDGKYSVDAKDIADRMVDEHLMFS